MTSSFVCHSMMCLLYVDADSVADLTPEFTA